MRLALGAVGVLVVGYGLLAWLARRMAEQQLFPAPRSSYFDDGDVRWISLGAGEDGSGGRLAAHYRPAPSGAPTVLFFHGNAEDLGHNRDFLARLAGLGVGVCAIDYRGYGLSFGVPSVRGVEADARAALRWLFEEARVRPEEVVVFGRSLGGGVATLLAGEAPVRGLVLESTFASVYRVVLPVSLFPGDPFPSERRLRAVRCPVLVIHGGLDHLIRDSHADALVAAARSAGNDVRDWRVPAAGHNDLVAVAGEAYWQVLREFLLGR